MLIDTTPGALDGSMPWYTAFSRIGCRTSGGTRASPGNAVRPSEVEFYVRDTGTGIDPEDLGKVFFVFRRGKNVAQNVAGKGVGLASVKSIIETYNGTIWVESEIGKGSKFRFTINGRYVSSGAPGPLRPGDEAAAEAAANAAAQAREAANA